MKKRYLLTALTLVVSVGFSSVLGFSSVQGSFALTEKKQRLTAPSAYDFSIVSQASTEYLTHEWTYGTPSNRFPLDLTKTGGNTWNYTGFIWNNTIYSLENNYAVADIKLEIYTVDIVGLNENIAVWSSNELHYQAPNNMFKLTVNNYSKYPIRAYFDTSSKGNVFVPYSYVEQYNNIASESQHYFRATQLNGLYIPPFAKTYLTNSNTFTHLDALYFDVISPTSTFQGYEDFMTDEAYNQGVVDTELNNVNWFDVIFIQGFGGVLSFIGNYEVLPNLKVFYIIGFTMVLAIVGFVAGQRKKD